jgi:hypothetical protein
MDTAMDGEAADQEWLTAADDEIVEETPADEPDQAEAPPPRQLDWWHRDHPTFFALTGFFSGLVLAAVLPAIFFGILRAVWDDRVAEEAFPFVLIFLALPISLIVFPRTRRFGGYLLFGMLVTLFVVFGVGMFVFWLMLTSST